MLICEAEDVDQPVRGSRSKETGPTIKGENGLWSGSDAGVPEHQLSLMELLLDGEARAPLCCTVRQGKVRKLSPPPILGGSALASCSNLMSGGEGQEHSLAPILTSLAPSFRMDADLSDPRVRLERLGYSHASITPCQVECCVGRGSARYQVVIGIVAKVRNNVR
jgi:hypothetical protein